ncbi:ATP-binding region ATPase domain protein [Gemmatirosa kalamazoonensis]|uniref:histidine kinase n=1 Tax=Gemmatirosa kalamazoonensis TaxID=861299 RepID=W0RGL1_9BACT|nr:ATP-binding protein [Gemmatirosa kalamazoonensis]AHG89475.1 ATP-binding region ATPase domain protein [Gemmatirosa kalamazoonensis]
MRRGMSVPNAARWAVWLGVLAGMTAGMLAVRGYLDKAHVALVYLLVVLGASADVGRRLGLVVATLGFLLFNALFLPPYNTLVVANPLDWIVLFAFLATSIVAAQLLARERATAETATARAREIDRLAALGAETLSVPRADDALLAIASVIRSALGVDECEVYQRGLDGRVTPVARAGDVRDGADASARPAGVPAVDDASLVAFLVANRASAVELADGGVRLAHPPDDAHPSDGSGVLGDAIGEAEWLPGVAHVVDGASWAGARALLLSLTARGHTVGVLRLASRAGLRFTPEQARLLTALAYYAALGVERVRLVASAERAEAERRAEQLRSALLMAVSHDLRTPLTTIKGIAHEVADGADPMLARQIEREADHLNALVGDLLDLSRIQAGAVVPNVEVNTVDDLLGAALQRAAGALRERDVRVEQPEDALLAGRFDLSQTLRIVVNLLENAAKYAPRDTPIVVRAERESDRLRVTVLDRGPGVPEGEGERIFEPFYRPPGTPPDVRGTGLGLSIARGLAEAQGGSLRYAPRDDGGAAFVLELPAEVLPDDEQAGVEG